MTSSATATVLTSTSHDHPEPAYRVQAVVDWIAFTVTLQRASHGGHLKNAFAPLGVSRVIPCNAGAGNAATEFRIELQHPERYAEVERVLDEIEQAYGLQGMPKLVGMEVSLDYWPEDKSPDTVRALTHRLMMKIKPPVIANPRMSNGNSTVLLPERGPIDPSMSLYIGNKDDVLLWRVYWKKTDDTFIGDEGERVAKPLAEAEFRARAEVRIQGEALKELGLEVPRDLDGFRFESLHSREYFKFCELREGTAVLKTNPYTAAGAESLGVNEDSPACVLGKFATNDSRHRPLMNSRYLETDTHMTEQARSALRLLTQRF